MKFRTLPIKRQPVQKGVLKRLSAVTRNHRRQRVAAASAADAGHEDNSSKISRALTIIFLFHILAIGLWFVHKRFLDGKDGGGNSEASARLVAPVEPPRETGVLSSGNRLYKVKAGESYARIAATQDVAELDLREANSHRELRDGMVLNIPPKRIVATEPPELAELRAAVPSRDEGLVDAVPVDSAVVPQAVMVRPNISRETQSMSGGRSGASGESYIVKSGDSVWGIANRFGIDQNELMKANGISDPRKLKIGMKLVIPR